MPGTAEPTAAGEEALDALATALNRRPSVGVAVESRASAMVDRAALARSQVELHVMLATAAAEPQARAAAIDLGSSRVQDVLDEFALERLGADERHARFAVRAACEYASRGVGAHWLLPGPLRRSYRARAH